MEHDEIDSILEMTGSQINVHALQVTNTTPTGIWTLNHIS